MSKSLKTIQTLAKIGKVLSIIAFVLSIIGAVGMLILIATLSGIKDLTIEGTSIYSMLEKEGFSFADMLFSSIVSIVACVGSAVVAKFAQLYFSNELEVGTPFTYEGAKEIRRLGILTIAIPAGIALASTIAYVSLKQFYPSITNSSISFSLEIGLGIAFIVLSVIFKYGAEFVEKEQYDPYNSYNDYNSYTDNNG